MMDTEKRPLPTYSSPPLAEVALSVQFARLQAFTGAHAGWFWKSVLDPTGAEWPKAKPASRIEDQFERFGAERKWGFPNTISLRSGDEPERMQLIHRSDERMVQLQDSRFAYNWRKGNGLYPRYDELRPAFLESYDEWRAFATRAGLGDIEENQWEVTYVNHIPKGDLWDSPEDWSKIIPGIYVVPTAADVSRIDSIAGQWRLDLVGDAGRLHVSTHYARVGGPDGPEAMVLQFTARGPIDATKSQTLSDGLDTGHRAIVETFDQMTSDSAHIVWERKG